VSNWLHASMAPGVRVRAQPPAGAFCIASSQPEKYLFVRGRRWHHAGDFDGPLALCPLSSQHSAFVQCARTEDDFLFEMDLGKMASASGLAYTSCRKISPGASGPEPVDRFSPAYLSGTCPDWAERQIYCCRA